MSSEFQIQRAKLFKKRKKEFDKAIREGRISPDMALKLLDAAMKAMGEPNKEFAKMFATKKRANRA